ncbi:MAG: antibiotic biosynthesis monooxygenase [Neomegalonema sp.]|nr:antibiotic biosynthesis monooxygenase [Neomegalonema sp.]
MADNSNNIVLINTFIVPAQMEDAFLQWWRMIRPMFAAQPGFVGAKLHRSLDQKERYRFINIAEWEGEDLYRQALSNMVSMMPKPSIAGLEWHPALYEVVEWVER